MSRVKLTEYRAKKIILGDAYKGVSVREGERSKLPAGKLVVKVDQGVKGRMKKGLVALDVSAQGAARAFSVWRKKGFTQFIVEPMMKYSPESEQYLSLERVRDGIRVLHAKEGGIDVEANPGAVNMHMLRTPEDVSQIAKKTAIPEHFLSHLVEAFEKHFFVFLEINPLIVKGDMVVPLDAAVLVDSAGAHFTSAWGDSDLVQVRLAHKAEERVHELAATTPASLKLNVLNKNGLIFFLLSGGGGSIVVADEAQLEGVGDMLGNYGEYSGGPTREETYLYAKEVMTLMLASKAKKKALVIAGGVANFTDIKKTFGGIIDALSETADTLRAQKIKVFVRRGGPNERVGLMHMRNFLERERLLGSVNGSDTIITKPITEAIHFVRN